MATEFKPLLIRFKKTHRVKLRKEALRTSKEIGKLVTEADVVRLLVESLA